MLVELPAYYAEFSKKAEIAYFDVNMDFFTGASITFFSFTC